VSLQFTTAVDEAGNLEFRSLDTPVPDPNTVSIATTDLNTVSMATSDNNIISIATSDLNTVSLATTDLNTTSIVTSDPETVSVTTTDPNTVTMVTQNSQEATDLIGANHSDITIPPLVSSASSLDTTPDSPLPAVAEISAPDVTSSTSVIESYQGADNCGGGLVGSSLMGEEGGVIAHAGDVIAGGDVMPGSSEMEEPDDDDMTAGV